MFKGKLPQKIVLSCVCVVLAGCEPSLTAQPHCRSLIDNDSQQGQAFCVIPIENKLVVLGDDQGKFSLPGGPVRGDSAACSLHQHVWLQTGLNVEVSALIETDSQQHFYLCRSDAGFDAQTTQLPVPSWAPKRAVSIALIDPFASSHQDWAEPDVLIPMRDRFIAAKP